MRRPDPLEYAAGEMSCVRREGFYDSRSLSAGKKLNEVSGKGTTVKNVALSLRQAY